MIKRLLDKQFVRFLLTGGLNTAFGFSMFALFNYLTNHAFLSIILANITGVLFNFKSYGTLVFRSKDQSKIVRFFGAYIVLIILQISALKLLYLTGIENSYLAGAITILPMALVSFYILRKFVFYEDHSKA